MKNNILKTTDSYKKEIINKYGNIYDLSKVRYIKAKDKVEVGCYKHGFFEQEASYFVNKSLGCPSCALSLKDLGKSSTDVFVKKAKKVHEDLYDYSLVDYTRSKDKVKIICRIHGIFEQTPNNHLKGRGCNECRFLKSSSKAENELFNYILSLGLDAYANLRFEWLDNKELDIYMPSLNLAFEYNGFVYHHSTKGLSSFLDNTSVSETYHLDKYAVCKNNNITLIHIFEFEDLENWKLKIKTLIDNNLTVSFENKLRTVKMFNKTLNFYGISNISHID